MVLLDCNLLPTVFGLVLSAGFVLQPDLFDGMADVDFGRSYFDLGLFDLLLGVIDVDLGTVWQLEQNAKGLKSKFKKLLIALEFYFLKSVTSAMCLRNGVYLP